MSVLDKDPIFYRDPDTKSRPHLLPSTERVAEALVYRPGRDVRRPNGRLRCCMTEILGPSRPTPMDLKNFGF